MSGRIFLLLAATLTASACYTWDEAPSAASLGGLDAGARLELEDGNRVVLERLEVRGDTLYATSGQCRPAAMLAGTAVRSWCAGIAIALTDVRRAEVRVVHRRRSAVLVLLGGLFGMALMVALLEMWTGQG